MEKYKVGLVAARRGGDSMKFYQRNDRAELTAVCDIDTNKLASCGKDLGLPDSALYTDFNEFLDKSGVDIVLVSTPIPLHEEQVIKSLDAGKHVLSEVTMSNTVEGCHNIWEAAKRAKTKYMLAENYVYYHFMYQWREYVRQGLIGDIHYAEAEYIHEIRKLLVDKISGETFWRTYRPPIHYCTHCLGPIMSLIGNGDYISKVTAVGNKNTMLTDLWPSTIDLQAALFETKQGRGVKICRSQVTPRADPHTVYYSVHGTKGFLENTRHGYEVIGNRYFEGIDEHTVPMACNQTDVNAERWMQGGHGSSDYNIVQEFLNCIEFDRRPLLDETFGAQITLPGIIAHEAAVQGNVWLDVPNFGW